MRTEAADLLIICGSRRDPSRTKALANHGAERGCEMGLSVDTLNLRAYPMELFDGRDYDEYDDVTMKAITNVLGAEMYLITSPVYFGGISGSLKNLIDHIPYERFQNRSRAAGLVMTGRDKRHQLVVDTQLRATLVYLGVDVATISVFATEGDFDGYTLVNQSIDDRIGAVLEETISLYER